MLEASPSCYHFLTNGDVKLADRDDAADFKNTVRSLGILGFSDEEINCKFQRKVDLIAMWRVLSAILLLGNLKFTPDKTGDQADLEDDRVAQKICSLLGVPVADLVRAFVHPLIKVFMHYRT